MNERKKVIELIDEVVSLGARQKKACELIGIALRTLQRWRQPEGLQDQRQCVQRLPVNKLSEQERRRVIEITNTDEYCNLPPCQIVPRLADDGQYIASESTFYRILREENMLKHRHRSRPKSHHKPKELVATAPNQVWSWDVTYLATTVSGMFYYLYLVMDVFSRKIVGWTVQLVESSEHASWLMQDICAAEGIDKEQVTLHSDNGAIMKGATLLATLQKLGVMTSFSRPSVSNDNPYSEALFKTLKYCRFYPEKPFDSLEEARVWVESFAQWYNSEHYHSSIKFITPEQRHQGKGHEISAHRTAVYETAKQQHPERWSRNIRNWHLSDYVVLNPKNKAKNTGNFTNSSTVMQQQKHTITYLQKRKNQLQIINNDIWNLSERVNFDNQLCENF